MVKKAKFGNPKIWQKGGIFILKIYYDPYTILCLRYKFTHQECIKISKRIKRNHRWASEWRERHAQNGADIFEVTLGCLVWYAEVETKKGYPLDLKIHFLEKYIEFLESYVGIPHEHYNYCDLPLKYLRSYFDKTKNAIGVATNRMQKQFPYPLKYVKDGRVYVSAIGIKWLNEKYFRTKYIEWLEDRKDSLENIISNKSFFVNSPVS